MTAESQLDTVAPEVRAHYAALTEWLQHTTGVHDDVAAHLLQHHEHWLLTELLQTGQRRRERLPVAVEASARWQADHVEGARFIVGATLAALETSVPAALSRLTDELVLPQPVRSKLMALWAAGVIPHAVQLGLARSKSGWSRRLYVEGGNLRVPMLAWEWHADAMRERTYVQHTADDLNPLGELSAQVRAAWQSLLTHGQATQALLRQDVVGEARALHVALPRQPVEQLRDELLALGRALNVPLAQANAWLDRLPSRTELTVVALGRDGAPQLNVYVAPNQDHLPQPGPPPGDLRRTPGTICWSLRDAHADAWRGWVLFAVPELEVPKRPAARSVGVHVWVSSAVPDGARLAQSLADAVTGMAEPLSARLAAAETTVQRVLATAQLLRQP